MAETKLNRLCQILRQFYDEGQMLVFVDTQEACDHLFRELLKQNLPCQTLHGGMGQDDRDSTIADFKVGNTSLLLATSVAARGLDVKDLVLVVNYEVPNHYEDYVHRVGRTGRAGNTGVAYTFITPEEEKYAPDLVKAMEAAGQEPPDDILCMANAYKAKRSAGALLTKDYRTLLASKWKKRVLGARGMVFETFSNVRGFTGAELWGRLCAFTSRTVRFTNTIECIGIHVCFVFDRHFRF